MSTPLFSIIVPIFNRQELLNRCLMSVLQQSFSDLELIVVDDGSTDRSIEVAQSIKDNRIKIFRQGNAGVSAARNLGAKNASGKWLIFLDSDDELVENALAGIAGDLKNEDTCYCYSAIFVWPDGTTKIAAPRKLGAMHKHTVGLFLAGAFVIDRSLFLRIGGYDQNFFFGENDELGLRIVTFGKVVARDTLLLRAYRVAPSDKNKKYKREKIAKTLEHYIDKYRAELETVGTQELMNINNRLAVCYFIMNKTSEAKKLLLDNFKKFRRFKSLRILLMIVFMPAVYRKYLIRMGFQ
jgi:glycosyltransferase involved in cell wall biosynthesis